MNTNFQPFCVGMFIGQTMAQLSAYDVGRSTARGRGRGQGRLTGPPHSQVPIPLEDIENYINYGWWVTARRDTDAAPFYGILHILVNPIRGRPSIVA